MRTKLLLLLIASLLSFSAVGCSLAYNGSRYQGGTGSDVGPGDSGMPVDMGMAVDMGTPNDTGSADGGPTPCTGPTDCPTMNTYCDSTTGMCAAGCDMDNDCMPGDACDLTQNLCYTPPCTSDADCMTDHFCDATDGMCYACDADGDGYYAEAASAARCARAGHLLGGDCDDGDANVRPMAPVDCSTTVAESCPLAVSVPPMIGGMTVTETGISEEVTLYSDSSSLVVPRGPVFVGAGWDAPALPSGASGGFVGYIAQAMDGTSRHVYASPLVFSGTAGPPEVLFDAFQVGSATITHAASGSQESYILSAVESSGGPNMGLQIGAVMHPPMAWGGPSTSGYTSTPLVSSVGQVSVGGMVATGTPAVVGILGPPSPAAPYLVAGSPPEIRETGGANVIPGTWMAGAGTAVIWAASPTQIGIWNGADSGISPPLVDLGSIASPTGSTPQVITPQFRGDVSSFPSATGEMFLAAVIVGSTATPPTGRIALIRWQWQPPASGVRTDATVPSMVSVHELLTPTGSHVNGNAGIAVRIIDANLAFVVYADSGDVVVRRVSTTADSTMPTEDPPSMAMFHAATGETFVGIDIEGGVYPDMTTMTATGRAVVAVNVEHGLMGARHDIRVRALEGCVGL